MSLPVQMAMKQTALNAPSLPLQQQMHMMPHPAQAQAMAQAQAQNQLSSQMSGQISNQMSTQMPSQMPNQMPSQLASERLSVLFETTAATWLAIGSLAESLGDLEKAILLYDAALRHNANNPDALTRLANIYRSRDHF